MIMAMNNVSQSFNLRPEKKNQDISEAPSKYHFSLSIRVGRDDSVRQMESNGGATSTRQNPNGNGRRRGQPRHGLECPEDTFVEKICGHEAI